METHERLPLNPELEERIIQLTRQNKKIQAIRELRKATRIGLAEAKDLVEVIDARHGPSTNVLESPADRPSPAEAAAALRAVQQAGSAGFAPIPGWFFPVVGLLVAGVMALQSIDPPELGLLAVGVLVVGFVVTERVYNKQVSRSRIAPRHLTPVQQAVLTVPMLGLWIAGEIVDDRWSLIWPVVAAACACWTIGYGIVHNRRARASA